jgi:hypothetical protein
MTTVTRTNLKCACGHQGRIVMRENDAPFSRQYEDYSLDGLKGDSYSVLDRFAKWDEVFREMKPVCPECGSKLTEDKIVTLSCSKSRPITPNATRRWRRLFARGAIITRGESGTSTDFP